MPPVHGGDEIYGQVAPQFKFEDFDASEHRVDVEEPVGADEATNGEPAATSPPVMERFPEGQDLPGMELEIAQGTLADFISLVSAAPAGDSPEVVGCQVAPMYAALASLMLSQG